MEFLGVFFLKSFPKKGGACPSPFFPAPSSPCPETERKGVSPPLAGKQATEAKGFTLVLCDDQEKKKKRKRGEFNRSFARNDYGKKETTRIPERERGMKAAPASFESEDHVQGKKKKRALPPSSMSRLVTNKRGWVEKKELGIRLSFAEGKEKKETQVAQMLGLLARLRKSRKKGNAV